MFAQAPSIGFNSGASQASRATVSHLGPDRTRRLTQEHGFRVIAGTGDFPLLNRLVNSEMELDLDQLFEFGLGRLLDGLERHLAGR